MYYGVYYIWMLPVIIVSLLVQVHLKSTYAKFSKIGNTRGMTGAQMAEMILRGAGIHDVNVVCINGHLTDHFDPQKKIVGLSSEVFSGTSIASIGIAAHECGHAIQHHVEYFPIRLRSAVVGITNFSSKLLYILIILSIFLSGAWSATIFNIAILCYVVLFAFQLITLPVEFNASARAVEQIESAGYSDSDLSGVRKVLTAAALTYVAAAITALWQLLIMLQRRRNNR